MYPFRHRRRIPHVAAEHLRYFAKTHTSSRQPHFSRAPTKRKDDDFFFSPSHESHAKDKSPDFLRKRERERERKGKQKRKNLSTVQRIKTKKNHFLELERELEAINDTIRYGPKETDGNSKGCSWVRYRLHYNVLCMKTLQSAHAPHA